MSVMSERALDGLLHAAVQGHTNSPAQNTRDAKPDVVLPDMGLSFCIDWLSFTLFDVTADFVSRTFFDHALEDFTHREIRYEGYRSLYMWESVRIYADGGQERGVHVDLTGMAVRQVEADVFGGDVSRWAEFCTRVMDYDGQFTRIDGACDQRFESEDDMFFTFDMVTEAIMGAHVRSKWNRYKPVVEYNMTSNGLECVGRSWYIGSMKSRTYLCMYDKVLERRAKGYDVDGEWLRTEVRWSGERANEIGAYIASGTPTGEWFRGVLATYINFLDPDSDGSGNQARREIADWWDKFLGSVEKLRLTRQKAMRSVYDSARWVERSVAITLAKLRLFYESRMDRVGDGSGRAKFWNWIDSVLEDGFERLTDVHVNQVNAWVSQDVRFESTVGRSPVFGGGVFSRPKFI